MKLVYGITFSTENDEIKRLVSFLRKRTNSTIVVQYDLNKASQEVLNSLVQYDIIQSGVSFNNDFSEFKNKLNETCNNYGADYIFQLDADEMISEFMVNNIENILNYNKQNDVFCLPRINTVEGITEEHIKKWGWKLNDKKYINFPDLQCRIFKPSVKWHNKVHETVMIGSMKFSTFPLDEQFCILHHKTIEKQELQNNLYNTL